jgi:SAM domain (Sterile alpha motif)
MDWSAQDVQHWLSSQEYFADCAKKLRSLNGKGLASLTEEQLRTELGTVQGTALFSAIQERLTKGTLALSGMEAERPS